MEEAVTRKFVHADSSHVISFCGKPFFISATCLCFMLLSFNLTGKQDGNIYYERLIKKRMCFVFLPYGIINSFTSKMIKIQRDSVNRANNFYPQPNASTLLKQVKSFGLVMSEFTTHCSSVRTLNQAFTIFKSISKFPRSLCINNN